MSGNKDSIDYDDAPFLLISHHDMNVVDHIFCFTTETYLSWLAFTFVQPVSGLHINIRPFCLSWTQEVDSRHFYITQLLKQPLWLPGECLSAPSPLIFGHNVSSKWFNVQLSCMLLSTRLFRIFNKLFHRLNCPFIVRLDWGPTGLARHCLKSLWCSDCLNSWFARYMVPRILPWEEKTALCFQLLPLLFYLLRLIIFFSCLK